jgi:ribonucleotide monophosphatase NagD (HAD superfamily)
MLEAAMDLLRLDAGDCVMVGDRLSTDIRMARAAGMASALVLTGDTTEVALAAAPEEDRPTWVLDRVDRLLPDSAWAAGPAAG